MPNESKRDRWLIIDGFVIDAELQGEHAFEADITEHEVEEGADIVDHIDNAPVEITVTGVVSDTPIEPIAAERGDGNPSRAAFEHFKEIRKRREPVTIQTSLGRFENMGLASLRVPTSAENGDSFRFTATFRQVKITTNERTTIPVAIPSAAKRVNRGKRPAKDAPLPKDQQGEAGTVAPTATVTLGDTTFAENLSIEQIAQDDAKNYRSWITRGRDTPTRKLIRTSNSP